ncbi:MAG: hypothetical protein J0M34_02150 [Alphaproteobacteria bacterium]|nr:hypothetical protein [Alphaproteobacteria bacterium]
MTEAVEDWQLAPDRVMDICATEPGGVKTFKVPQDGVALDRMLKRILQNIAGSEHYGFSQTEIQNIKRSPGMISLGEPDNQNALRLAHDLQELTPLGVNEPLFAPFKWKVSQPEALICKYSDNSQRLCDAVNALVDKLGMRDIAQKIIHSEMKVLEYSQYATRG